MKAEDLYDAISDLSDGQITEGERKLPRTGRVWARWVGLAAVLALAVLAAFALRPERTAGHAAEPGGAAPAQSGEPGVARPDGGEAPTEDRAESTLSSEPGGEPGGALPQKYSLAGAAYPKMSPYPVYGTMNGRDYEAAWLKWRDEKLARQPDWDYAAGMEGSLQRLIPALLEGAEGENRTASPLNVWMALALLAESTDGRSRQELLELLEMPDLESLRKRAETLWLANYCDDGLRTSILGASLWLRDDRRYDETTLKTLAERYYASSFSGPMGTEDYNETLRSWANEQTGGLLQEQIGGLEMNSDTMLALITTVWYQAPWEEEFCRTEIGSFHSPAGNEAAVFLQESASAFCWFGEDFTAAGKPLREGGSMYFLLPGEGLTPEALLGEEEVLGFLSGAVGRDAVEQRRVRLELSVPKFDVSSELRLTEPLKALGVDAVFDPEHADFSPLTGKGSGSVYVTDARHGARVLIDEKGVTAAAITEALAGAAPPPEEKLELILDRPFLFVLTNAEGLPLFVGVVNDPTP